MTEPVDPRPISERIDAEMGAMLKEFEDDYIPAAGEPLTVRKLGYYTEVSCCLLTDSTGVNHCEHPQPEHKPQPWTWRLYEWWWDTRERLGRRIAGWRWPEDSE